MKKLLLSTIIFIVLSVVVSDGYCMAPRGVAGSGIQKTEQRVLKDFTQIDLSGSFDINITCQKALSFEIKGDDNILPLIITEIKGSTLYIYPKKSISPKIDLEITLTIENIEKISTSGSIDITIVDVKNQKLAFDTSGSSDITAIGETNEFVVDVSGSSDVEARKLQAQNVKVSVSGSGDAIVYATESLDVDISGSGNLVYYGDPKEVKQNVSGSGEIKKGK